MATTRYTPPMRKHGISNAHVTAAIAQNELVDLAIVDGGNPDGGRANLYNLKKYFKGIGREEDGSKNRGLDRENERGYIPSHDIATEKKG